MHQRSSGLQGADVFRQALTGGLVDEIELRIAPVLFDAGTGLLDTRPNQIKLEATNVLHTPRNASMMATSTQRPTLLRFNQGKRDERCARHRPAISRA